VPKVQRQQYKVQLVRKALKAQQVQQYKAQQVQQYKAQQVQQYKDRLALKVLLAQV
jgi:hypothetical protein